MNLTEKLNTPGEYPLILDGLAGQIEAIITIPEQLKISAVAFLGHPHSLQGGTMNNKVVTTMVRVFKELGIPSLRFNFRGVGLSAGVYNDGIGESEDMIALVKAWQKEQPNIKLIFAGFSFGSYVTYRAAAQLGTSLLISIAPPVHHYDYQEFTPAPESWLIVQGDADKVVPASEVIHFANSASPPIAVINFSETGHFFHGKLLELKAVLVNYIQVLSL